MDGTRPQPPEQEIADAPGLFRQLTYNWLYADPFSGEFADLNDGYVVGTVRILGGYAVSAAESISNGVSKGYDELMGSGVTDQGKPPKLP